MKSKRFNRLRFSQFEFFCGLGIALLFSAFIYLDHWGINWAWLHTFLALSAFFYLLKTSQGALLVAGFFIGVFWFYWVGYSFRYVDMAWVVPFVALFFGLVFALPFWLIGFTPNPLYRALWFWLLSYYEPFYFNWFKPELLFIDSFLGIERWQYGLVLLSLALFLLLKKYPLRWAMPFLLLFTLSNHSQNLKPLPFSLARFDTKIEQNEKWNPALLDHFIAMNFALIDRAIKEKKDVVLLPESTFPLFLNQDPKTLSALKKRSYLIDIVAGSLYYQDNKPYNATYFFHQGNVEVAKKMVLVPFGEYIPLPKFLRTFINNLIFQNGEDYIPAKAPSDFIIKGTKVRNAICYEATTEAIYKDNPKFIFASSNNGWFTPSIEPTLQRLLMRLYAMRHKSIIIHSANASQGEIIH